MKVWRRSRYLSFFRKGDDVFMYHDLSGDIVRMDEKLLAFLDFFADARPETDARKAFKTEFVKDDLDAFFEILPEHKALVPGDEDEQAWFGEWFPVRGPWILAHVPKDGDLTLGYRDRRADKDVFEQAGGVAARVFKLCDGSRSLDEVAQAVAADLPGTADAGAQARAAVFRWTHSDRQLMKLIERPLEAYKGLSLPPYVASTMPYARLRGAEVQPSTDAASTRDYHREEIVDAREQFEVRETTLSHAFRVPHPALGGKTYGARLATALVERDFISEGSQTGGDPRKLPPISIVEVGGGTGLFARGFLDGLAVLSPRLYHRVRSTICDLAPELQRSQARETVAHKEHVRLVRGDAVALPLRESSVDFLLANEMIADLETVRVRKRELEQGEGQGPALAKRYRLDLKDAPEEFWLNKGTFEFLAEVKRVLKPGARALVTEFGEIDRYPVESTHLDHREFSIHFGHARSAAEAVGLQATIESVPDLLELDGSVPVLVTNRSFFTVLRAFLAGKGVALEKIAYTKPMLEDLVRGKVDLGEIEGIHFEPAGERVLGLRPREFKALVLKKPADARPVARRSIEI